MMFYSILMLAVGVLFFGFAIAIYRGNTDLIHSYHQTNVKEEDKEKYGKAFSKGMFILAVSLVLSGLIALLGESVPIVIASIIILVVGFIAAFIVISKVQKKFNGGF